MMAASGTGEEPSEIELLLPWHAAGTLNARDTRRVNEALAGDRELARQYAVIREEYAETIHLNESLGAPSARAMQKLFAALDAEPVREARPSLKLGPRFSSWFARLSPRTLAWSAALGALVLVLQAGVIATVLIGNRPTSFQTASLNTEEPITRDIGPSGSDRADRSRAAASPHALVRFAPDARMGDVTALLDKYQASIVDGANGGMFRLRFAKATMSKEQFSSLLSRLQNEKIVSLAVTIP